VGTHVPTALAGIVHATGEQADRIRQYFAGLGQMLERVQCLEMALRIAAVPKSGQSGRSSAGIAGLLAKTLSRRD
jgi:hypothetical protein